MSRIVFTLHTPGAMSFLTEGQAQATLQLDSKQMSKLTRKAGANPKCYDVPGTQRMHYITIRTEQS